MALKLGSGKGDPSLYSYDSHGRRLHELQVEALEWVDEQLGVLLGGLPNKKPLLTWNAYQLIRYGNSS